MGKHKTKQFPEVEHVDFPLFDAHCHLDLIDDFRESISEHEVAKGRAAIPPKSIPEIISDFTKFDFAESDITESRLNGSNSIMIHSACDLPSIERIDQIFQDDSNLQLPNSTVYGAVAIHPNEVALHQKIEDIAPDGLSKKVEPHHQISYQEAFNKVVEVSKSDSRIKAIGETGLDFFRTADSGKDAQIKAFRDHIQLAKELNLPLQIHDRLAHQEIFEILNQDGAPNQVIFHSFSGDPEFAQMCIEKGYYLSFSGALTYKSNEALRQALITTPTNLLLAETDAPFLTPEPYRGSPNLPIGVYWTIKEISELLELPIENVASQLYQNGREVFNIKNK